MSIAEWSALLVHLNFVRHEMISVREARHIFMWSRLRQLEDSNEASQSNLRNLSFEDFLEALIRLATLLPLPSDKEINELNATDAGDYLVSMFRVKPDLFREFVAANKQHWQEEPKQPTPRCVDHLMAYLSRVLEESGMSYLLNDTESSMLNDGSGDSETKLSPFVHDKHAHRSVKTGLLDALRKVEALSALNLSKLARLRDTMIQAPFIQGDYVIQQGDDSDTFYVIIKGEALALRTQNLGETEKVLCKLQEGSFFGELSLLESANNVASVQARFLWHPHLIFSWKELECS